MSRLLIALVVSLSASAHAAAQITSLVSSNATSSTEVEANAVGPQDSVGTSGTSPTKNMMKRHG
ncbi:hypothetical protein [Noviherbaspirillum aerium]|uniref:hypothetical protein n=1 Tax=Noviherbaspirillum aerium TaxID=2588497 RepID=UPI00124E86B5|nr:hypothetical protein [Noviherbaspirillum aerium]